MEAAAQNIRFRLIDLSAENVNTGFDIQNGSYCVYLSSIGQQERRLLFTTSEKIIRTAYTGIPFHPGGQVLIFHPELIRGTFIEGRFNELKLFNANADQSLHLSKREYQMIAGIFFNLKIELTSEPDTHSHKLMASNIQLFLNYCERFSNCAQLVEAGKNTSVLQRFDQLLSKSFIADKAYGSGIPSVAQCAEKLNLSANYFGTLVKKETGKTAQEYIRDKLIEEAAYKILNSHKTINEIAYDFGFKYPQHFSRFFKKVVGHNPTEYRTIHRTGPDLTSQWVSAMKRPSPDKSEVVF
ncbi:Helix-turn-helix domain-containing protein [Pedobacter westerhofensis]|uniref:Helix-turn-helix domain-containing protein n=1 Tax=Pedobacter westerhofensis TaxID=425512 RepID=A0A521ATZ2_9SPHI|nr:response regulator transcription factor [Pedobacter westerhofensis]SMO38328.1 Helix-turn-helix domain-containing protein [Pedobacter westerhofensis]